MKPHPTNHSRLPGAMLAGEDAKWISRIKIRGRAIYLGHFFSPEEASRIYRKARNFFLSQS